MAMVIIIEMKWSKNVMINDFWSHKWSRAKLECWTMSRWLFDEL